MDHKTWLWRKKPSEKTIVATDKTDQNEEEVAMFNMFSFSCNHVSVTIEKIRSIFRL